MFSLQFYSKSSQSLLRFSNLSTAGYKTITYITIDVFFLQFDEMWNELEEYKEISSNRLNELEKLTSEHQEALKEVEKLKMDVSSK